MHGTAMLPPVSEPEVAPAAVGDDAPEASVLPAYLEETYRWAYLRPASVALLDHDLVASLVLWGQMGRLRRMVARELAPGARVLQPACVYGGFSRCIAERLGPAGRLEVRDVAPIQVENCRRKLARFPNCRVTRHDAGQPTAARFDAVLCFFLLHELPADWKRRVMAALLGAVRPGGKAIFVDYHRPHPLHPLCWPMRALFARLEPFAEELWRRELREFAPPAVAARFRWRKTTRFGGLYQMVVARRTGSPDRAEEAAVALDRPRGGH